MYIHCIHFNLQLLCDKTVIQLLQDNMTPNQTCLIFSYFNVALYFRIMNSINQSTHTW